MFKPGDKVKRNPRYYDVFWVDFCEKNNVRRDQTFIVESVDRRFLKFNGIELEPDGNFMEHVKKCIKI